MVKYPDYEYEVNDFPETRKSVEKRKQKEDIGITDADMLKTIFKTQYFLQKNFGVIEKINNDEKHRQEYINLMVLSIFNEINEALNETCFKNPDYINFGWKKKQNFNKGLLKEELIDIFHFFINLCIAADLYPEELFEMYMEKNRENIKRNREGY